MSAVTADSGVLAPERERRPGWLISALRKNRWWVTRILMLPVQLALFALVVFVLVRAFPATQCSRPRHPVHSGALRPHQARPGAGRIVRHSTRALLRQPHSLQPG